MSKIAIIGAGAWGTALSIMLGRKENHRIQAVGPREKSLRQHRPDPHKR